MVTGSNPTTGSWRHLRRPSEKPDLRCRLCFLRPEASSPPDFGGFPLPRGRAEMARVRAGQASGPERQQTGYPGEASLKGCVQSPVRTRVARRQKCETDGRACSHSGFSPLCFWTLSTSLSSSSQDVTRAARQGGSKKHPQEARKAEPGAWNHAEVRGPGNHAEVRGPGRVILRPGPGASGSVSGGRGTHQACPDYRPCPQPPV